MSLPQPGAAAPDESALFLAYLDHFRSEIGRKVADLDESALTTSRLPSGWTPAELVEHLVHMERRWLVWGFLGEEVPTPWGDQGDDGRWTTDRPIQELLDALDAAGRRTRAIVMSHSLPATATPGGRFIDDAPLPTLLAILFHVLQEYARHTGHLDVVRELIDGTIGEE